MTSETCANCGKDVPNGAKTCPNCGAAVIPKPTLDGSRNAAAALPPVLWSKTAKGDVAIGVTLGILLPIVLVAVLIFPASALNSSLGGTAMLLAVLAVPGVPIFVAARFRREYRIAGGAMQKTLWGWLIFFGVSFLGLFAMCLTGNLNI